MVPFLLLNPPFPWRMQKQCPPKKYLLRPESKAAQLKEVEIQKGKFGQDEIYLLDGECGDALGSRFQNTWARSGPVARRGNLFILF